MKKTAFIITLALLLVLVAFSVYNYVEINAIKAGYATYAEVPSLVSSRLESCNTISISKDAWDFESETVYPKDICKSDGKLCFASTMLAFDETASLHAFGKGDKGCNFALSRSELDATSFYTVLCC